METTKKTKQNEALNFQEKSPVIKVNDGFFAKPLNEDYHIKVYYDEIIWVEAISNYSYIHFKKTKTMSLAYNIGRVEKLLLTETFVRINRSEIINIHLVDKYCGNMVSIAGHGFTVSPSCRQYVFSCFLELRRDE